MAAFGEPEKLRRLVVAIDQIIDPDGTVEDERIELLLGHVR
jgi:hypothetical protein